MTYWWTHMVADIADWFPGGLYGLALAVLLVSLLVGLALQNPRLYRFKRRATAVPDMVPPASIEVDDDESVPELPVDALTERAQRFMAAGRYREAVREWLRVMVRDLIDTGVIEHAPGMTVTELAAAGGQAVPGAASALTQAATVFSDVWYGDAVADLVMGTTMRDLCMQVRGSLAAPAGATTAEVTR